MKKEFVMRGKTESGLTEVLEFGGRQKENRNMAYRLTEFILYPSTNIGDVQYELAGTVTAAKTLEDPSNPNFTNEGLIGTSMVHGASGSNEAHAQLTHQSIVNDTFLITQNLILAVVDTVAGSPMAVNWQCRFEAVKMTNSETAVNNYKQFAIFDE